MKTAIALLTIGVAYISIDTMPAEVAGAIGLGFIAITLAALIAAIVTIGKRAN